MFDGAIAIATSTRSATCCAGLSAFGVVVCATLSHLFKKHYAHLGSEWKAPGMTHEIASANLAQAAALYGLFLGLSIVNLYANRARGR
jgi:hypothetical protein